MKDAEGNELIYVKCLDCIFSEIRKNNRLYCTGLRFYTSRKRGCYFIKGNELLKEKHGNKI